MIIESMRTARYVAKNYTKCVNRILRAKNAKLQGIQDFV